jgi:ubiquinone/menaquinone biosynthesis C-methylase UbiE
MKHYNKLYPTSNSLKKAHLDYPDVMPDGWFNTLGVTNRLISSAALIPVGSKVLDVGCNSGEISLFFKKIRKVKPYCFDISFNLTKKAKKKKLPSVCAEAENIPFKNNTFDCVYVGEMIEHTYEPEEVLSECNRVLKAKGFLVGSTLNEDYNRSSIYWEDERKHARPYTPKIMYSLVSKFFENVEIKEVRDTGVNMFVNWIIFKGEKRCRK